MNKRMKSIKKSKNSKRGSGQRNGKTKVVWIQKYFLEKKLKKRYQSSFDDSKMLLLEFEVRNYFDWINRSNAIIKS